MAALNPIMLVIDLAATPGDVTVTFIPPGAQPPVTGTLPLRPVVKALPANVRAAVVAALTSRTQGAADTATTMTTEATALRDNAAAWQAATDAANA